MRRQAEQYRPVVEKYADRYNLSPDLVFAIIYTESDFDPDLISNRSAHGLMQVVPDTAGGEVHRWLGRTGKPSPSLLLHPETNIKYGTAYMYLLQNRHLSAIADPQSREYSCRSPPTISVPAACCGRSASRVMPPLRPSMP